MSNLPATQTEVSALETPKTWTNLVTPFALGVATGTVLYMTHVEFSPGMGNIWLRPDSYGNRKINLTGLLRLMKSPFSNSDLWKWENLDLNYVVVACTGGALGVLCSTLFR